MLSNRMAQQAEQEKLNLKAEEEKLSKLNS